MESQESQLIGEIFSEVELLSLLNINKRTLDELRLKRGFPFIRLNLNNRVYLYSAVLQWLKTHSHIVEEE